MYYGTYTINKAEVKVEMPTSWSHVYFTLQLTSGERGRFTHLVMERHSSISRNDPRAGLCNHPVKSSDVFTVRDGLRERLEADLPVVTRVGLVCGFVFVVCVTLVT